LANPTLPGNCLILRFEHDGALTTSSVQTDKGDTFSAGPSIDSGRHATESYYVAPSTGSQVITVVTAGNLGSDPGEISGDLSEFYNTSCVVDASGSSSSRSVTLSPNTENDLIWQSGDDASTLTPATTSMTVGSGYTMLQGNISQGTFAQYTTGASTGPQSVSFQTSDSDSWQSVAIAFQSALTGAAPPSSGMRIVNMYGEIFGNSTHTMYVPCSGNLLIGMWSSPAVTISAISSSPAGTWSQGASSVHPSGEVSQIFYGQGMNCSSTLTMTPTYSEVGSGGLNFLVVLDVAGAAASAHDVDRTNVGDQTFGSTLVTDTITPNTANGLIVDSTSWWGCTDISASPGLYAGIATNSGDSNVCAPSNTTASTLNEDNGLAFYYNPSAATATFTYTTTGAVQQWASVASAFKAGAATVSSVSPNTGSPAGGTAVTIAGTNFAAGATVTFGAAAATNVVVVSGTEITATTPAGSAGAVTVTVTNSNGLNGTVANAFSYVEAPTVSSVSPNSGSMAGGTAVTITGMNFAAGATVTFGSTAAANVSVVNGTTITATTPAGIAGAVTVTVTLSLQSGTLVSGFSYVVGPTVSGVAPNNGPAAGGTAVTITGTNFAAGATVTFGATAATNVVVVNSTSITATTPTGSAGAAAVTVTVNGQSGGLTNGFTYIVPPTVSSVSPNSGSTLGGTAVTITGTNFGAAATVAFGVAAATSVVVVSGTQIIATTPADSAGAVTVTVTNLGSQSGSLTNGYTYVAAPAVSSLAPNNGPVAGGTAVTITGTNFAAGATVQFGGLAASNVVVVNSTTLTAAAPAGGAGAVTVTVTLNGVSGSLANGFTYTGTVAISFAQVASATPQSPTATIAVSYPAAQTAGDLNVVAVGWNDTTSTVQSVKDSGGNSYLLAIGPTIGTALQQSIYYAPAIVGGGNTVTVTFNQAAALPDIRILEYRGVTTLDVTAGASGSSTAASSGAATTTNANELVFGANMVAAQNKTVGTGFTSRIITVPDSDLAEDKIVTAAGSNSATATLTAAGPWVMQMATFSAVSGPAPTVSGVAPGSGSSAGGTAVTITGTNFAAGAAVTFGIAAATSVVVVNGTTITATAPAGTAGAVTVTVTNPGGQSGSLASAFTYIAPPAVSIVSPNSGAPAGGTAVTITGTAFAAGATVTFGAAPATDVVVVSGTQITATTPAGSVGAVTVTVTNSNGLSGSLAGAFSYVAALTVSSVSPNSASTAGGTAVTITGMNFAAGVTVTFGGTSATNVAVVNGTTITATTPAGAAGAVTVTVTVSGQSGTLVSGFSYVVTPTVSGVTPDSGPTAGGTAVTITGAAFAAGATVTFGAAAANNVVVVGGTQITATTPAGGAGAVTVTVTNSNGPSGSLSNAFSYYPVTAVTIQTSPPGLQFSVDGGAAQTAPQTLNLSQGSHIIAVVATEPGTAGTQYVFTGWSDSGAASHSITVGSSPFTYTATFQTQYQLTTAASPSTGGTVTPASGTFQNTGSVVTVQAAANAGYQFANFSGALTGSGDPQNVTMNGPANVVANFTPIAPNLAATVGTRTVAGSTVLVSLTLTNTGLGAANDATITGITAISDVAGSGAVSVASGTPVDLGTINPGASGTATVTFNWPSTATRVSFTVNFTADGGYTGSTMITTLY